MQHGPHPEDGNNDLLQAIEKCRTVHDFDTVYSSRPFQARLEHIEAAQLGRDITGWAKEWAEKLSQGDEEAISLNNDRRLCLRLLYAMCDCWKPKEGSNTPSTVSDLDIITIFKTQHIRRILSVCLPMDRANAWYNMIDGKTNQRGMHWYSQRDGDLVASWREQFGQDRLNQSTINKRLTWLFDLEGLGLSQDGGLLSLMTPSRTPLASSL